MNSPTPVQIEYARLDVARQYRSLLPYAFACGGLPLSFGTLTFLLWCITRHQAMMLAGFWTILIGLLLFGAGCILLLIHTAMNWWFLTRCPERQSYRRSLSLAWALLLINFPVCMGFIKLVLWMDRR